MQAGGAGNRRLAVLTAARDRVLAALAWLRRRLRRSPLASIAQGEAVLAEASRHTSCPVQDVSSRLGLPLGTTFRIVAQLEEKGLVRVSRDAVPNNRIVAITSKGRAELKR